MTKSTASLGDVAEVNPRLTAVPDGPISFLGMADIREDGTTTSGVDRDFSEVRKGYTPFSDGDILLAKITPCFQNGKIAQAKLRNRQGMGSTEFHVIRGHQQIVDQRYLLHFLRRKEVLLDGERRMTGSGGQRRVPVEFVKALEVPLPPLPEQRRIAAILDHADALRAKRRATVSALGDLGRSAFSAKALTASPSRLGDALTFVTSGGRGWAKYYVAEGGSPFIRSLDVQMNSISDADLAYVSAPMSAEAKRTQTEQGDVLLTITGSRIGRAATLPASMSGSHVSQHVAILRPDTRRLLPEFLSAFLCSEDWGQRQIRENQYGQTKPGLNFEQIRDFTIPLPEIERQREFVANSRTLMARRDTYLASSRALDSLFVSLQSQAFRGDL